MFYCSCECVDGTVCESVVVLSHVQLFAANGLWPARFLCPWNSPGKITGVGCHFLLQGIFLTQGSNPGLPHFRQILYCLSHPGSTSTVGLPFTKHHKLNGLNNRNLFSYHFGCWKSRCWDFLDGLLVKTPFPMQRVQGSIPDGGIRSHVLWSKAKNWKEMKVLTGLNMRKVSLPGLFPWLSL